VVTRGELRRLLYYVNDESFTENSDTDAGSDGKSRSLEPTALDAQILVGAD